MPVTASDEEKTRMVLKSLIEDEITMKEASELLNMPDNEIQKMLDDFVYYPSGERLKELCEAEIESMNTIREMCDANKPESEKRLRCFLTLRMTDDEYLDIGAILDCAGVDIEDSRAVAIFFLRAVDPSILLDGES